MLRKINLKKSLPFILPAISGLLLVLTYPFFNFKFLAWIALVPLFFSLENQNIKERFLKGYIFGFVFFFGTLYWLFGITVPGTIAVVLYLSIAPAIFTSICRYRNAMQYAVIAPAAWVLSEYLRAHIFTGFPWVLLGHSQSFNLSVIQIADITGVYGVSFLIILVNVGIYFTLKKTPNRFYVLFFIFLIFVITASYGYNRMRIQYPSQELKISAIQGNIPQEDKWDPANKQAIFRKYRTLTLNAIEKDKSDFILWPETAVVGFLEDDTFLRKGVENIAKENNVYILTGTLRETDKGFYNSATLVSNEGKLVDSYDKIRLVPFGEFIPFRKSLSWIRNIINRPIGEFERGTDFKVFRFRVIDTVKSSKGIQKTTEFFKFSVLICYEDIFPELARKFVQNGAKFLVNITNDAWFGKTSAPYQHMQGSIFRAIENRVPVVRAANTGVSCIIDHRGKVIKMVNRNGQEIFVDGYVSGVIKTISAKTVYTKFGDVFAWICIVIVLMGFIFEKIKSKFLIILIAIILSSQYSYAEGEIYYRGKLDFTLPLPNRYDYVTRVIDGDTIDLRKIGRVRLLGIDTPESRINSKLERDAKRTGKDVSTIITMGKKATEITMALAMGKKVRVEFDVEKKDRYDRWLAYIYLPDGRMLNAELIKEGYAQVYTFPPNVKYTDRFLELQREAREEKRGFWKEER